jgi:hypothetical protein
LDVESFPYGDIADDLGEIQTAQQVCEDIYYVSVTDVHSRLPREYYVFSADSSVLSSRAKAYGTPLPSHPDLLCVSLGATGSGSSVIYYEALRYKLRHNIPLSEDEDIHVVAVYGTEENPEYFGSYPAPLSTPHGAALRYLQIIQGVFAVETERGDRMIAIAYPIWSGDLSAYTKHYGLMTPYDIAQGIHHTYGYLFFPEESGCLPLFELSLIHKLPCTINLAALKNAVFERFPDYALRHNSGEVTGQNDHTGKFYQWMGVEVQLSGQEENLITWSPSVGMGYLIW